MILRLYTVSATVTAVMMATSELAAEKEFKARFGDIISDQPVDAECEGEVRAEDDIPEHWGVDCLPYGAPGNALTIGELLDVLPPPVVRDTKTLDMFGAAPGEGVPA